jgi:hypothetical protein
VSATNGTTELKIGASYTFKPLSGPSQTFLVRFFGYP